MLAFLPECLVGEVMQARWYDASSSLALLMVSSSSDTLHKVHKNWEP